MATFLTNNTSIEIQEPRFPYEKGARPLIIHHQTRDGSWKSGSITGKETAVYTLAPRFVLSANDYTSLYEFITETIGNGLVKFVYYDGETPGDSGSYLMTYLDGLSDVRVIDRNRYDVTLRLEGRLRNHRNAPS